MAKADKKHHGAGLKGKGDGTGAMTELQTEDIPANAVLSNRDKKGSAERGMDGREVLSDQYQDHVANRRTEIKGDQS